MPHTLYILRQKNGRLYIGVTSNLSRRLKEHGRKSGSPEAAHRKIVEVVYKEAFTDKKSALKRELQLKHWSRAKKEALIKGDGMALHLLAKRKKEASKEPGFRNLGPVSLGWLKKVGIKTPTQLHKLGSVKAYLLVRQREPRATLNLLWGLEAAIQDIPWTSLTPGEKARLKSLVAGS